MITLLFLLITANCVSCVCYFPMEYQGIFATQSSLSTISAGSVHQYSQVTILPDAIPVWGVCHKKFDNSVILRDPTGGQDCFRCFHVSLHSGNVIQIYTEGLNKCYSTEEAAVQTCPTLHDIQTKRAREIMLYKSRSFTQDGLIDRIFCPINGRYRFTYDVNDGTESSVECPEPSSELSNCPKGSQLQLRFRRCSFGELDMGLRCLGDWEGHDGQKYLALWDPEVTTDNQPRYRCAMYSVEETTGRVYLGFSIDATCTNHLHSPWDGYETMVLTPVTPLAPPAVVHTTTCAFPEWAQGSWQNLQINSNELWLQDNTADKKYQTLCLSQHAPHGERYALYSQTQCGEEEFTCIWIKKRAVNVIEYQMSYPSDLYNASRICSDDMFRGQVWDTQGRLHPEKQSSCPITGEYTGIIPDATELCARLYSDCNDPQHMYYTVSSCFNASEVYEDPDGISVVGGHDIFPFRHRRSRTYRISDPKGLLLLSRTTRGAHAHGRHHGTRRKPSWAHIRAAELGSWSSETQFTTIGASNRRRHRHQTVEEVYVFPDVPPPPPPPPPPPAPPQSITSKDTSGGRPRAQAQHQARDVSGGDGGGESGSGARISSIQHVAPTSTATTSRPPEEKKPFYVRIENEESSPSSSSPWDHLKGMGPVVIEEREYRCLGQWSEGGVMYTFTHREDVNIYECFAGVVVNSHEIFIIEAGTSCQRGLQPLAHGMKLVRQATCSEIEERGSTTPPPTDPSSRPPWWPPTTVNPWVKKTSTTTEPPSWNNEISRAAHSSSAPKAMRLWTRLATISLLLVALL